ncbi:MAG TPA: hypothetical protein VMV49_17055 [Candidatus Deferrimicrobium sp.]|nr:hypothetical protein [Candidatus Deferrimicrobium sp.]
MNWDIIKNTIRGREVEILLLGLASGLIAVFIIILLQTPPEDILSNLI